MQSDVKYVGTFPIKYFTIAKAVVKHNGKYLVVQRNRHGDPTHKKWELPGGKVEYQEIPPKTAEREVLEETGWIVKHIPEPKHYHMGVTEMHKTHESFLILIGIPCKRIRFTEMPADKNVMAIDWKTKTELRKLQLLEGTIELIEGVKNC